MEHTSYSSGITFYWLAWTLLGLVLALGNIPLAALERTNGTC